MIIVTVNTTCREGSMVNVVHQGTVMDQASLQSCRYGISFRKDNTGCVNLLVSIQSSYFFSIVKTTNLNQRLKTHNSGSGSLLIEPIHLIPYALSAYICGFNGNSHLMYYAKQQWKEKRDESFRG